MNKLLIVLLFPFAGFGQTLKDTTEAMLPLTVTPKSAQQRYDRLSLPAATSTQDGYATKGQVMLLINTAAKAGSTETAVTTLTADVKALATRVQQLEALAPGLPVPVNVSTSTYTLTLNDNGKTIQVANTCTVNIPPMAAGFKCWVVRKGGRVSFTGNFSKRASFTPLASIDQKVEIHYDTATKATIY